LGQYPGQMALATVAARHVSAKMLAFWPAHAAYLLQCDANASH